MESPRHNSACEHDHSAGSGCDDSRFEADRSAIGRRLGLAIVLTTGFVAGEAVAAYLARSVALFADAGHNFADAAALGFSWYALRIARRPAHPGMTFGYHRVGILAALANAVSLVVIALLIVWEAIGRLQHPDVPHGGIMAAVAGAAVVLNVIIGVWLHRGAKHDLNVRSAYLHMVGDAVSAAGVVLAGILIYFTGSRLADPLVSFLIAGLILWSSWGVLKESVNVLLEGTPAGMDMAQVVAAIRNVSGVLGAHDLHVWTVGAGAVACCVHVLVSEQTVREGQQIVKEVVETLAREFRINHATVQVEVEGCDPNAMYCCIEPTADAHAGHHH